MRFKHQQQSNSIPEVNLVPMMDVLMTVLTFFIIISMTLTGQHLANVRLPQSVQGGDQKANPVGNPIPPLVVGLTQTGEMVFNNQPISLQQLTPIISTYLTAHPDGRLVIQADRGLAYRDVATLLNQLQQIGGNRVSLAVE